MNLQCLCVEDDITTDAELADLAGNAFCMTHVINAFLTAMYGLALGARATARAAEAVEGSDVSWETLM